MRHKKALCVIIHWEKKIDQAHLLLLLVNPTLDLTKEGDVKMKNVCFYNIHLSNDYTKELQKQIYMILFLFLLSEYKHYLLNIHIKIPNSKIIIESFTCEDRSAKHRPDTCNIEQVWFQTAYSIRLDSTVILLFTSC